MNIFDSTRPLIPFEALGFSDSAYTPKKGLFSSPAVSVFDSGSTSDSCSTPNHGSLASPSAFDENYDPFGDAYLSKGQHGSESNRILQGSGSKQKKSIQTDRFVPNRKTSKFAMAFTPLHEHTNSPADMKKVESTREEDPQFSFKCLYKNIVLDYDPVTSHKSETFMNTNIFRYSNNNNDENLNIKKSDMYAFNPLGNCEKVLASYQNDTRKVTKTPYKVLDAPGLQDDFYLNLVDWSSQNVLGVGLSSCVYLWSAQTSKVSKLCDLGASESVTSISWAPKGPHLGVGTSSGDVQVWDMVKMKKVRVLSGHTARVSSIAWSSSILASGSRDKNIHTRDLRCNTNYISTLVGHRQEVCGLKWSFDEQQLASGGNDNKLFVWGTSSTTPLLKLTNHTAAVKALAWSPHQHGLLASGGGTADRTIRFWNTLTNQQIDCVDTGSQVCNLMFSKNSQELVSTHGYSQNQIFLWKYPTMDKVATLTGHSFRVLYLAMSPDGENIVTGAGDETLRFWNLFQSNKKKAESGNQVNKLKPSSFDLR